MTLNIFGLEITIKPSAIGYATRVYKKYGKFERISFIKDVKLKFNLGLKETMDICRPIYQKADGVKIYG